MTYLSNYLAEFTRATSDEITEYLQHLVRQLLSQTRKMSPNKPVTPVQCQGVRLNTFGVHHTAINRIFCVKHF